MKHNEAMQLRAGEQVEITYLDEPHTVRVISSPVADRWSEKVTVEFNSGAVLALHYEGVRPAPADGR